MRRRVQARTPFFWVAGFCAYAVCLLVLAPATLLDAGLAHASHGRLRIAEARGTLWSGTGQLEILDAAGRGGIERNLSWNFQPQSVLGGQLGFLVDAGQGSKRFPLTVSIWRIQIVGADFVLPAAALGIAAPRLAVVEPTGDLRVHIATLSLVDGAILGNGIVEWRAAGSSLTSVAPLGDYELRFQGSAGGLHASLRTVKGLLQLEGTGSRGKTGPPLFFATARVGPEHQLQLAPLLRLIGIERVKGNFTLQLNQGISREPDI